LHTFIIFSFALHVPRISFLFIGSL
jgi:hypothetical protein